MDAVFTTGWLTTAGWPESAASLDLNGEDTCHSLSLESSGRSGFPALRQDLVFGAWPGEGSSAGPGVTRESLTTAHSELLFIVSLAFVYRALPVFKNTVLIKIKIRLSIYISGVLVWFGF